MSALILLVPFVLPIATAIAVWAVVRGVSGALLGLIGGGVMFFLVGPFLSLFSIAFYMSANDAEKRAERLAFEAERERGPSLVGTNWLAGFRVNATIEAADGTRWADSVAQSVRIPYTEANNGLGDPATDWTLSGANRLKIPLGGQTFWSPFEGDYARRLIDACVSPSSYDSYEELVALLKVVEGPCRFADARDFIAIAYQTPGTLPDDITVVDFAIIPFGGGRNAPVGPKGPQ